MHYFRLALFTFLAVSNIWRLAVGAVSGWMMAWSVSVVLLSIGAIVWLVVKRRR